MACGVCLFCWFMFISSLAQRRIGASSHEGGIRTSCSTKGAIPTRTLTSTDTLSHTSTCTYTHKYTHSPTRTCKLYR
jgi:hypothetical protein